MNAGGGKRLDQLLVERGFCDSREQAKRLILAGEVRVDDRRVDKPATKIKEPAELSVLEKPPYVSRGGLKLAGALEAFEIDPQGMVCLDAGASTGGFTDCLLQRGAAKVFAFDVGTNQLVWKLRSDPRVVSREKFNVRHMVSEDVGEEVDLVVIDVSFISLTLILPPCFEVLKPGGDLLCLIKPQFELSRGDVGSGGIVRDEALRLGAIEKIRSFCEEVGKCWRGSVASQISGMDGNQEYLAWIKNRSEK